MIYECKNCSMYFSHPAVRHVTQSSLCGTENWIEYNVCPYCMQTNYIEWKEKQPQITSVKSIDLAHVDELLKQGYEVHELYAKTATLVKWEQKVVEKQEAAPQ